MFSDITQMDSCKPPAVCASVHYDTARKAWVPLVKLIQDGKEISYPCDSRQRLCVMRGEESVEIDGEEVSGEEREELALKYPQFDEHYDRIKDLKEVIAGYTTSFFVCDDSEDESEDEKEDEKEKSDDDEKEHERERGRRGRTPPPAAVRMARRMMREEKSDEEKSKDKDKDKDDKSDREDDKSDKEDKEDKDDKDDDRERERKASTPTSKLRRLASRRGK